VQSIVDLSCNVQSHVSAIGEELQSLGAGRPAEIRDHQKGGGGAWLQAGHRLTFWGHLPHSLLAKIPAEEYPCLKSLTERCLNAFATLNCATEL
jgi:hypothetical protein